MESKEECSPSLQQRSAINEENGGEGSARTPNNETQAEVLTIRFSSEFMRSHQYQLVGSGRMETMEAR